MKRGTALLIVLALLCGIALGEAENPAGEAVELLFAAVAGVRFEEEMELRRTMMEEEAKARTEANAAYRESVLPWLMEVFDPQLTETEVEPAEESAQKSVEAAAQKSMEAADAAESEAIIPTWEEQIEAAYAALQTRETGAEYLNAMEAAAGEKGRDAVLAQTREYLSAWLAQVDHKTLKEINEEYLCWIYCVDSPVDYPVAQAENNSKYLHMMLNGEYNSAGTLFADYRNLPDFQDPNTLIYGHHMRNGSMFGMLVEYKEQAYFDSHPYWLMLREEEIDLIELFAGYTTGRNDHCYDIAISDEEDKALFVEEAKAKSDFDDGVMEILPEDHLVTLSTCAYAFQNARYIAIGKIMPVWKMEIPEDPGIDIRELRNHEKTVIIGHKG